MKKNSALIWLIIGSNLLFALQLTAKSPDNGFTLLDEVCVVIDGEPVLRSHINKLAHQKDITFKLAESKLMQEKLMWVYARKNPVKYNINDIFRQVDHHINEVMEKNDWTKEKFAALLMRDPYFTTFTQYRLEAATATLENIIKSSIRSQISIEAELQQALAEAKYEMAHQYEVVFISVLKENQLSAQFKKANEIHAQIRQHDSLDEIKKRYGGEKNISIVGPIAYEKGALKSTYDEKLKSDPSHLVTKPFRDDSSVTIIWKIKKSHHNKLDEDALLEEVRKKLYEAAVEKQFNSLTNIVRDDSTAIVKNCKKL